jgi:subtilisin family serine protease
MTGFMRIGGALAGCALLAACADDPVRPATDEAEFTHAGDVVGLTAEGDYIVWLRSGASASSQVSALGGTIVRDLRAINVLVVRGLTPQTAGTLQSRPEVRAVVPDLEIQWLPRNELGFRGKKQLVAGGPSTQGTDQTGAFFFADQWNIRQIEADDAYGATPTGAGSLVCVLDSGVDPGQLDLVGKVDLTRSASFIASEPFIEDLNFHGTFVSALISSNGLAMASVAPDAKLCAVKVLSLTGTGPFSALLNGIVFAANVGADVINMSLSAYIPNNLTGFDVLWGVTRDAVQYARDRGVQLIAAAGNDGADLDRDGNLVVLPAEIPGVLAVAATAPIRQRNFDRLAFYSNRSRPGGAVDLAAPGGEILNDGLVEDLILSACSRFVCGADGFYVFAEGTSFAAPHAAAVGALAESSLAGNQNAAALDRCLMLNLDVIRGNDGFPQSGYGQGRLNALRAGQCLNQ